MILFYSKSLINNKCYNIITLINITKQHWNYLCQTAVFTVMYCERLTAVSDISVCYSIYSAEPRVQVQCYLQDNTHLWPVGTGCEHIHTRTGSRLTGSPQAEVMTERCAGLNCRCSRTSQQPHQPAHITIRVSDPLTWGQEVDRTVLNSVLAPTRQSKFFSGEDSEREGRGRGEKEKQSEGIESGAESLVFPSWTGCGLHPDRALFPTACLIRKKWRTLSPEKKNPKQSKQQG